MTQQLTDQIVTGAMQHMNTDHRNSLLNYAKQLAGCDWAESAEMTTLSATGFDLSVTANGRSETHHIPFETPVNDGQELRSALIKLADKADVPDGIVRVATSNVHTPNALRYVKALTNHFNRKAGGSYEGNVGTVNFPFGDAVLEAQDDEILLRVSAESDTMFDRVKDVVGGHLERFAQKETLTVAWVDAPAP